MTVSTIAPWGRTRGTVVSVEHVVMWDSLMSCNEIAHIPQCDVLTNQPIIEYMMLYVWCLRSNYMYVLRSLES